MTFIKGGCENVEDICKTKQQKAQLTKKRGFPVAEGRGQGGDSNQRLLYTDLVYRFYRSDSGITKEVSFFLKS